MSLADGRKAVREAQRGSNVRAGGGIRTRIMPRYELGAFLCRATPAWGQCKMKKEKGKMKHEHLSAFLILHFSFFILHCSRAARGESNPITSAFTGPRATATPHAASRKRGVRNAECGTKTGRCVFNSALRTPRSAFFQ